MSNIHAHTPAEWIKMGSCPEHPLIRYGWCKWPHRDRRLNPDYQPPMQPTDPHDCNHFAMSKRIGRWRSCTCGLCNSRWGEAL